MRRNDTHRNPQLRHRKRILRQGLVMDDDVGIVGYKPRAAMHMAARGPERRGEACVGGGAAGRSARRGRPARRPVFNAIRERRPADGLARALLETGR